MKRYELIDHLKRHGCVLVREGGRHSVYASPSGKRAPVPRHNEIDNRLARTICDQLQIPSIR